eukprot:jgi/Psemu1/19723/gm1.19723_g
MSCDHYNTFNTKVKDKIKQNMSGFCLLYDLVAVQHGYHKTAQLAPEIETERALVPSVGRGKMIPRLQPRPSSRRPSGIENMFVDHNSSVDVSINTNASTEPVGADSDDLSSDTTVCSLITDGPSSTSAKDELSSEKDAQLLKKVDNPLLPPGPPLAPAVTCDQSVQSPVPNHYGSQHKYLLLNYSSSLKTPLETDADSTYDSVSYYNDFSLTPPTAGSRPPLLVSAKRYGSEVRRQHNKKRRRRRRPTSTRSGTQKDSSLSSSSIERDDYASNEQIENDNDALCLWKCDSSIGGEQNNPHLFASSDEEEEQSDRIEQIVRAEHLKQGLIFQGNDRLPIRYRPFSAKRVPPPKGWPPNSRGHAHQYKTPSKSLEQSVAFSESNCANKPRRVQFGIPSAVEYEIDRPAGHLTPLSQEVTRKRYSMDPKVSTREEEKITKETKENNMILSAWEDRFSDDRSKRRLSSNKRKKRNRLRKHQNSFPSIGTTISDSPSDMVTANLASLSMSPPSATVEERGTSTTPMPTAARADKQRTWGFIADLGTINSKGARELSPSSSHVGAAELERGCNIYPNRRTEQSMTAQKNASPARNAHLDSINSFGAAFDNDSPNRKEKYLEDCYAGGSSLSEWDFATVVANLSLLLGRNGRIQTILTWIDPCVDEAFSCANALSERVMRTLGAKSKSKKKPTVTKSHFAAEKVILAEWASIEVSFLKELTSILERNEVEIVKKTQVMEASMNNCAGCVSNSSPCIEQVEKEVSELRAKISREKSSSDILEACTAPRACILCQATAQIGIYGFYLEEFKDDHILKLKFIHSMFGVTTDVMFDLNSHPGVVIGPIVSPLGRDKTCILNFHRKHLDMVVGGEISIRMDSASLQDSLLNFGQFLGKLDQSARTFLVINDEGKAVVRFDFPHILLRIRNNGTIVRLTLNPENFVSKTILVYTSDGEGYRVTEHEGVSSMIDCCDLRSLRGIVSRYA